MVSQLATSFVAMTRAEREFDTALEMWSWRVFLQLGLRRTGSLPPNQTRGSRPIHGSAGEGRTAVAKLR